MSAKLFASALCCIGALQAQDLPIGIAGGYYIDISSNNIPYGALISPNTTNVVPLSGFSTVGSFIYTVAMNDSRQGIVGGSGGSIGNSFVGIISPGSSNITPVPGLVIPNTNISSVSISNNGTALIGGGPASGIAPALAAFISPSGAITTITGIPVNGYTYATAMNSGGNGVIGGKDDSLSLPFAALVYLNNPISVPISGISPTTQAIFAVAINNNGTALISGFRSGGDYAAFVAPNGSLSPLIGVPSTVHINAVAINDSGTGLLGGKNATAGYAALVSPYGILTTLNGTPFNGSIASVAINNSGTGLIGGDYAVGNAYAALVSPSGSLTVLNTSTTPGTIFSVAINEAGVGLIGGENASMPYAAIIAPNGALTPIQLIRANGIIYSVSILDDVMPESIGSYRSAINTQLAATYALESHLTNRGSFWRKQESKEKAPQQESKKSSFLSFFPKTSSYSFFGSNSGYTHFGGFFDDSDDDAKSYNNPETNAKSAYSTCPKQKGKYPLWATLFGNYVQQDSNKKNPSSQNEVVGILVGIDQYHSHFIYGAALGYAYNFIQFGNSAGHGDVQEEMIAFYGTYERDYLWINAALWGGLYQLDNKRYTYLDGAPKMTSTSDTHGWLLTPHVEIAATLEHSQVENLFMEPFVMFDWVNNWQEGYTESGSSGFNLKIGDKYTSLLRSEIGLRLYQTWQWKEEKFLFKEKVSYVSQAPFNAGSVNTSFVASASSFPIAIGNAENVSLCALELNAIYFPSNPSYPYFALDVEIELSSPYQSYFAGIEVGKTF